MSDNVALSDIYSISRLLTSVLHRAKPQRVGHTNVCTESRIISTARGRKSMCGFRLSSWRPGRLSGHVSQRLIPAVRERIPAIFLQTFSSGASRSRPYVKGALSFMPTTMVAGRPMLRQIVIEAETPGDSRTMFRLRMDASIIADGLTAVQAHVLVGEILERVALPKSSHLSAGSLAAQESPKATLRPRGWSGWRNLARRREAFHEVRNEG